MPTSTTNTTEIVSSEGEAPDPLKLITERYKAASPDGTYSVTVSDLAWLINEIGLGRTRLTTIRNAERAQVWQRAVEISMAHKEHSGYTLHQHGPDAVDCRNAIWRELQAAANDEADKAAASTPTVAEPTEGAEFESWWDEYQKPYLPNGRAGYSAAKDAWSAALKAATTPTPATVVETARSGLVPQRSGDVWREWFDSLGERATAEVVNATANLVTNERLNVLQLAGVLPSLSAASDAAVTAAADIVKAWLWHTPEHDQERARKSIAAYIIKHFPDPENSDAE